MKENIETSIELFDITDENFFEQKLITERRKLKNVVLPLLLISFILPIVPGRGSRKAMIETMNYSTAVLSVLIFLSLIFAYLYYATVIRLKRDLQSKRKIVYTAIVKKKEKSFLKKKTYSVVAPIANKENNKVSIAEEDYNRLKVGDNILLEYSTLTKTFIKYKLV